MTAPTTYAEAAEGLLRRTVLDAVDVLVRAEPWDKISMAEVAAAAGVSRQTLYNEFGSRDELARAYVLRLSDGFLASVEAALGANASSPPAAMSAAFEVFLVEAAEHPVIRTILSGEGRDGLLSLVASPDAQPLLTSSRERLVAVLTRLWPIACVADLRVVCDLLVRLAISHATMPAGSPSDVAADVTAVLAPHLDTLLA